MLTLTDDAVTAIRQLTSQPGLPADTGLRIATTAASDDGIPTFELALAAAPQPEDQVLEKSGVRVFLDPEAQAAFDDKSLDAETDEESVRFQVTERPS